MSKNGFNSKNVTFAEMINRLKCGHCSTYILYKFINIQGKQT